MAKEEDLTIVTNKLGNTLKIILEDYGQRIRALEARVTELEQITVGITPIGGDKVLL